MTGPLSLDRTARVGAVPPARAVVHAAGTDTEYLRSGRGNAIVVVADDLDAPELGDVIASLADRYLVLAASPVAANAADFARWFNGFLEGLGISSAHLLLHSSKAMTIGEHDDV